MRKKASAFRRISKKDIEHLAWLSRISLSKEEKKLFTEQLNDILNYFKLIDEADTEDVPPTYNVLDLTNVFRRDIVKPSLPRDEALKNAPKKEKGYFKAPRIV
jgi:aspartyl-tRNA(Asn)/glutamyl-tRNA(Gln) amidotransferase subunit C